MDKISPLLYINDTDPVPEAVLDASGWFATEYIDFTFVENEGQDLTGWFLAQGWKQTNRSRAPTFETFGDEDPKYEVKVSMMRRKMQSERVLNSMIASFTNAYNEGRSINDQRYDEIVALYNVMLDKSENELGLLDSTTATYDALVESVIAGLPSSYTEYKAEVDALLANFGTSHRTRINTQFDNELTVARQSLVSRGTYNTTVWTSVASGIEERRAIALNDLEDKIIERKLASADRVQKVREDVSQRLEAASLRFTEAKRNRTFTASGFRNTVLTAMLAFMERRTDDYPGLEGLAEIAAKLGYSEGGTVAPVT